MSTQKNVRLEDRHAAEKEFGKHIQGNPEQAWWQDTVAGRLRMERRGVMLIEGARIGPGKTVLEIGSGTGNYTLQLAKTGARVIGVDISPDLLSLAKQKVPNAVFLEEAAEVLPSIEDHSVDAVVGNAVLHHLDVPLALKTFHRVLKPGGILMFTEPNMLNPQIALQKNIPWLKKLLKDSPHETAFIRWNIAKMLRGIGFTNVRTRPFDFLHPWTPSILSTPIDGFSRFLEMLPIVREIAGSLSIRATKPA